MSSEPIYKGQPEGNPPLQTPTATTGYNNRILIVEDEQEVAQAYLGILAPTETTNIVPLRRSSRSRTPSSQEAAAAADHPGFEVTIVHSAPQALETVRKAIEQGQPFAMGFFDVMLGPGMDGVELVRQIREMDPNMYAVFVTAYNDRSVDSINSLLGADKADRWDYLNKPFSDGEIYQKARSAVTFWNLKKANEAQDEQLEIAQRKLLENERSASMATVARSIGHEFGNILMQIMGRAELSRGSSTEEMEAALDMIFNATVTASHILEKFKDLAKTSPESSAKDNIVLSRSINEAIQLLQHRLQYQEVEVELSGEKDLAIWGSHTSFVQIFVNLLINSIHAMEEGGTVLINIERNQNKAEVSFRDSGPGIPNELLEKVLEPFFTTKNHEGTGLGLAICREIVEIEHSGEFEVSNHPQGGAQFKMSIPIKAQQEENHE